jgi:hypothetical protein
MIFFLVLQPVDPAAFKAAAQESLQLNCIGRGPAGKIFQAKRVCHDLLLRDVVAFRQKSPVVSRL